ncbi:glucose-fructose oxidoreductase [Methylobacterium variabile]|jgi:predicted dehydrogenase|uniref:Glucose-fructose oxidoreductase n=1 Tax=Methylobacterium variabile TaxID=298794 RepID=A0A0J6SB33_9HYPH|nr:Gfo/Idh/MocA family oxidoreductase [Methylobacterium variabile]KMO32410.1 glucose-fructose oxidoreductase [Methylobacterium variabile]
MSITGSIAGALGLTPARKVRYAFVGLGDIAQEAMLPGVAHTGNSEVAALVTGDPEKARALGARYGVSATYAYEQFGALLRSGTVDALYLATPNWRHAEFAVPALQAGIHVLVEKPLEVSLVQSRAILDAARASRARLMVAYRLHFEPATLATLDLVRSGQLGEILAFTSTFTQMVSPDNHRARSGVAAGPVFDMGPYPVNAARAVFGAEPTEVVSALGLRHPEAGLGDLDDTVAVTLRFPGSRLAQFVLSYVGNTLDTYTVVGTKGSVTVNPGYMYGKPLEQFTILGEERGHARFKNTDHFGGELKYFSDCILAERDPEPDGEEGYADVRVLDGIVRALETGGSVTLEPFARSRRIDTEAQEQTLPAVASPPLVAASNPGRGKDRVPKN